MEFRDKRVAKKVAASLHNTPMGTRKRQRFSSDLWCMKVGLFFPIMHTDYAENADTQLFNDIIVSNNLSLLLTCVSAVPAQVPVDSPE